MSKIEDFMAEMTEWIFTIAKFGREVTLYTKYAKDAEEGYLYTLHSTFLVGNECFVDYTFMVDLMSNGKRNNILTLVLKPTPYYPYRVWISAYIDYTKEEIDKEYVRYACDYGTIISSDTRRNLCTLEEIRNILLTHLVKGTKEIVKNLKFEYFYLCNKELIL